MPPLGVAYCLAKPRLVLMQHHILLHVAPVIEGLGPAYSGLQR